MPQQNQNRELARRYREIDFVAEFQKYWAYFNKWFMTQTGAANDRVGINALKTDPIITRILTGLFNEGHENARLFGSDRTERDLYDFLTENRVSGFVRACWECALIRDKINLFNRLPDSGVRATGTVNISIEVWRDIYTICRGVEAEVYNLDKKWGGMNKLFEYSKISNVGSAFFKDLTLPDPGLNPLLQECWQGIESDQSYADIVALRDWSATPGVVPDLMEMLYLVRNHAMHGELDFVDESHNAVSSAGLFLLQGIIEAI